MKRLITSIIQQLLAPEFQILREENTRLQLIVSSFQTIADANQKYNDLRIKHNNLVGDNSELQSKNRQLETKIIELQKDPISEKELDTQNLLKNLALENYRKIRIENEELKAQLEAIKINGTAEDPQKQANIQAAFNFARQYLGWPNKEHFNNIIEVGKLQAEVILEAKIKENRCDRLRALHTIETHKQEEPKQRKPYTKKN